MRRARLRTSEFQGTLAIYDSSAGFGFEVPTQTRGYNDRNFKSTALGRGDATHLPAQHGALAGEAPVITGDVATFSQHPVTRHHEGDWILSHRGAHRARGFG